MTTDARSPRAELATFLCLTFASSAVFYWLIIRAGSLGAHGGSYVLGLMWCPGTSGLVTRLVFQRNLRGEGWASRRDTFRWAGLAYVLPILYATVAYGLVWAAGLGAVDMGRFRYSIPFFLVAG